MIEIPNIVSRVTEEDVVLFAKNQRFNVFFHRLSPNRGGKGKNSLFGPRQTLSAKIEHVGVYFAKMGCKIEVGFTDIFGFQVMYLELDWSGRWGPTFASGRL